MPRNTLEHLLRLLDRTLKPAVGEGVPLIEVKVAFIGKEAVPSIGVDVLDVAGADDRGGEVDEVFSTWFHLRLFSLIIGNSAGSPTKTLNASYS